MINPVHVPINFSLHGIANIAAIGKPINQAVTIIAYTAFVCNEMPLRIPCPMH